MSDITDLLERYRRGPEHLASAIAGADDAELDFKPAPEKWSARQIIAHLADTEAVATIRFRQIVAEDEPTLFNWDQNAWAERTDYHRRDPSRAIRTMRFLREDNCCFLEVLAPAAFSRAGIHTRRGRMTLLELLKLFSEHVEKHCNQIRTAREAYQQSQIPAQP
jgi:hypothetical protein